LQAIDRAPVAKPGAAASSDIPNVPDLLPVPGRSSASWTPTTCGQNQRRHWSTKRRRINPVGGSLLARLLKWSTAADYRSIGKLVVDLISDSATVEFTSCIPGTSDSFSKKKRSYASMSGVTILSKKSTDPIST